ncbi:AraC family transcriptional regulator [Paraflavisolibacter sp. H34]|uniref:helix-turn-helix domain-containing protein n=1 Tax=Huijunlia imazamoxiresistens TaxID=3127457 RepID=UPI003016B67C
MSQIVPTVPFVRPDGKLLSFELIPLKNNVLDQPEDHHRHDFYSVLLVLEGQSRQTVDFKTYTVNPAQVLVIPKGSVHLGYFAPDLEGYFLLFTADFFDARLADAWQQLTILNPLYQHALIETAAADWDLLTRILALLAAEYPNALTSPGSQMLQHLLLAFLWKLEEVNKASLLLETSATDKYYLDFFYLLDTHFRNEHGVGFYADSLNITPKKLSGILTRRTGKSTADLITDRLLLEGRRQLSYSHDSVKEIAYDLGFNDPFYFSRLFKKKQGLSPEQFRAEFSQKSI